MTVAHVTQHLRPPQDTHSFTLNISEGCSHGQCRYCSSYRYDSFRPIPMDEIQAAIDELAPKTTQLTKRIYLTGGNPIALPNDYLAEIFDRIETAIPTVNEYGAFCCIRDVARKSDEELAYLVSRGVKNISIGAESGLDWVLEYMNKGQTAKDIVEQSQRLHDAGMDFTFFYLAGIAGAGHGEENALASAEVFNAASPTQILVVTLTPVPEWPLREAIEKGEWTPPTEVEIAEEIRSFVGNLTCHCKVDAAHDTNIIRFEGMSPKDCANMVELLNHQIPSIKEGPARRYRELIHRATF